MVCFFFLKRKLSLKYSEFPCSPQHTTNRVKRQHVEWENIFANHMSDKRLIPRMYREPIQLNSKETNNLVIKWVKSFHRHFPTEDTQMADKHMKRCSKSLIITGNANENHQEMPLHTHEDGYYQIQKKTKCGWGCREIGPLVHCRWGGKMVQSLRKTWQLLKS